MSDPVIITVSGEAPDSLVTEQEYAERAAARPPVSVDESPFAMVDTEAQFDAALASGRSMVLRGEGSGGVIPLTTPKVVTGRYTEIKSDAGAALSFTLDLNLPAYLLRGITVHADDVTFRNFELTSTHPVASNPCYGIAFSEGNENHGHRMKVLDMHIHNWRRCISKDGSLITTPHEDILISRVYCHTFNEIGAALNFGFTRLTARDSRFIGRVGGATHQTHNGVWGGSNWRDCVWENCLFADVSRIGIEATIANYDYYHERTQFVRCVSRNCGSMGFSAGFGTGIIYDKCKVDGAVGCGIELCGRPPEHDPSGYVYAQGIIDGCQVENITGPSFVVGISVDGARDSMVRNTRLANVSCDFPDEARGIWVSDSERSSIRGCNLENAGHCYVRLVRSSAPRGRGLNEVVGNTFRNLENSGSHLAVYVEDTTVEVGRNIIWQKPGTSLTCLASTARPSVVTVDGVPVAEGLVGFGGSNIQLPS